MPDKLKRLETKEALTSATITGLKYYPLKGGRGQKSDIVPVTLRGLEHDRELMAVEAGSGIMITQRKDPRLALITTKFLDDEGTFVMEAEGIEIVAPVLSGGEVIYTTVHSSTGLKSVDQGDEIANFASGVLGKKARIVRLANNYQRIIKPEYAKTLATGVSNQVGFADGAAISLASNASANRVNEWIAEDTPGYPNVPLENYRANIEVDSFGFPFAEDLIAVVQSGDLKLHFPWLNARCVVTTTGQNDGTRNPRISEFIETRQKNAMQPLYSLGLHREAEYWPGKTGLLFGINVQPELIGINPIIKVGDRIKILKTK